MSVAEFKEKVVLSQDDPFSIQAGKLSPAFLDRFSWDYFERTSDAVFLTDKLGEIVWINIAAQKIIPTGQTTGKTTDHSLSNFEKGFFPLLKSIIKETLEDHREYRSIEESCIINGNVYTFLWDSYLIIEKNQLTGMMLMAKNITQIKLSHEEATRYHMQKLVDQVASGLAHEIRNPLTAVRGFIQLLHESLKRSSKREYLQVALDELDRANSFIKDFLLFVRPAAPNFSLVPLEQVIEEALSLVRPEALINGIQFEFLSTGNLPLMYLDLDQIRRAFCNILQNAVDFTDIGIIKITVVNDARSDKIIFSVQDSGCGIPDQNMSRIFDPFFTTKEEAPGMGLTLTQSIIKNHGGEISVSNHPEGGAVFSLELYHVSKYPDIT